MARHSYHSLLWLLRARRTHRSHSFSGLPSALSVEVLLHPSALLSVQWCVRKCFVYFRRLKWHWRIMSHWVLILKPTYLREALMRMSLRGWVRRRRWSGGPVTSHFFKRVLVIEGRHSSSKILWTGGRLQVSLSVRWECPVVLWSGEERTIGLVVPYEINILYKLVVLSFHSLDPAL